MDCAQDGSKISLNSALKGKGLNSILIVKIGNFRVPTRMLFR